MDNTTPTLEYVYTLKKSLINKIFDQPKSSRNKEPRYQRCECRSNCIDFFLWWENTKEGFAYWNNLEGEFLKEKDEY